MAAKKKWWKEEIENELGFWGETYSPVVDAFILLTARLPGAPHEADEIVSAILYRWAHNYVGFLWRELTVLERWLKRIHDPTDVQAFWDALLGR